VHEVAASAADCGVAIDASALFDGAGCLLELVCAVKPRVQPAAVEDDVLIVCVGRVALHVWGIAGDALTFFGETVIAFVAFALGCVCFRRVDLLYAFEATGVSVFGIVVFINFLIGVVLAFVGAVQF
jgi:phospholipid/cholesterol/gamma-HCH transport system permease protein